ncbi:FAD:protein FMN transferase [Alloalcanivorax mobilis]|uniref:FAD:protein FMN transferase n=1 Tax=Alloalcanivorax mobilis TaxID=2019569 RepID=UPI000C763F9E|nr:FAD:protein FMN transferase [Alloalcanivorax mobilis]
MGILSVSPSRCFNALLWALLCVALLSGCGDDSEQRLSQLNGDTMGTTWSVKFTGTPDDGAANLKNAIQAALDQVNDEMSTYREDSALSRFNNALAGTDVVLPADFALVLSQALKISRDTGGAYDVTVGPLVNLWGFGPDPRRDQAPTPAQIDAARQRVGYQKLKLDHRRLTQPGGVYVDLSSIAKGFAVDKVADVLAKQGLRNYLVEVGGELRAAGHKPYDQPWRIAVERPVPGVRDVEKIIELHNVAIATSGDYRNFFESEGHFYSHTIDPRTGAPVGHKLGSVTVLHSNCMIADGLATALTVLGPDEGLAFAKAHELAVLFIVRTDDGPREILSPAFQALLDAQAKPAGQEEH